MFAFVGILAITVVFFRFKWLPSVIVVMGMVLGTVLTMGFTYATVGQLNMITSILGGILMGFGVDYGIHFIFRTRIELGTGKSYDVAIRDALICAGRPAAVAAVVTGGSFGVLLVSQFRGFSQFGFLAGIGTLIIGITMFSFCAACLALLGRHNPAWPKRLVGEMVFVPPAEGQLEQRIAHPGRVLGICCAVVALICAFAIPWAPPAVPSAAPSLWERLCSGVTFNYNTRALMPAEQHSVALQDEIGVRFKLSSDPVAVYTKTLQEAREVYDAIKQHPERYPDFDQVVSIFSFVPPKAQAAQNAAILRQWRQELRDLGFNATMLPAAYQGAMPLLEKIFAATPYEVEDRARYLHAAVYPLGRHPAGKPRLPDLYLSQRRPA